MLICFLFYFNISILTRLYCSQLIIGASSNMSGICDTMLPPFSTAPFALPSPYEVTLSKRKIRPGEKVTVTIRANKTKIPFRGFYLQAKEFLSIPVGSFEEAANVTLLSCGIWANNMAIHSNFHEKYNVMMNWSMPLNVEHHVYFYLTIIKGIDEYWFNQTSTELHVLQVPNSIKMLDDMEMSGHYDEYYNDITEIDEYYEDGSTDNSSI